jgi:GNAT superfamily N-acetyltransferase
MDILEGRPDQRGKGYGRLLAEFMVERAFGEGHSVAEIEIAPASALPF